MGHMVSLIGVVAVVRCEQWRTNGPSKFNQHRVGLFLFGQTVVLEFNEQVVLAEDVLEASCSTLGFVHIVVEECLEDHSTKATGRGDDAFVVLFQQLPVEAGLVVVALEVSLGRQLEQVSISLG